MGAGQLDAHASPPEAPDRLLVEALGPVAVAQEGAQTRLHPERPITVARVRGQREQVKRPFRGGALSGASSRLHELGDRPLGAQFRIRCDFDGLAYRVDSLPVATETVVENCAGLSGERQREALA